MRKNIFMISAALLLALSSCGKHEAIKVDDGRMDMSCVVRYDDDAMRYVADLSLASGVKSNSYKMKYDFDGGTGMILDAGSGITYNQNTEYELNFESISTRSFYLPDFVTNGTHKLTFFISNNITEIIVPVTYNNVISSKDRYALDASIVTIPSTHEQGINIKHLKGSPDHDFKLSFLLDNKQLRDLTYNGVVVSDKLSVNFAESESVFLAMPSVPAGDHVLSIICEDNWGKETISVTYNVDDAIYNPVVSIDASISNAATRITIKPSAELGNINKVFSSLLFEFSAREATNMTMFDKQILDDKSKNVGTLSGSGDKASLEIKDFNYAEHPGGFSIFLPNDLLNDHYALTVTLKDGSSYNAMHTGITSTAWDEPARNIKLVLYVSYDPSRGLVYSYEGMLLEDISFLSASGADVMCLDEDSHAIGWENFGYKTGFIQAFNIKEVANTESKGGNIFSSSGVNLYTGDSRNNAVKTLNTCIAGHSEALCSSASDTHILDAYPEKSAVGNNSVLHYMLKHANTEPAFEAKDNDITSTKYCNPVPVKIYIYLTVKAKALNGGDVNAELRAFRSADKRRLYSAEYSDDNFDGIFLYHFYWYNQKKSGQTVYKYQDVKLPFNDGKIMLNVNKKEIKTTVSNIGNLN